MEDTKYIKIDENSYEVVKTIEEKVIVNIDELLKEKENILNSIAVEKEELRIESLIKEREIDGKYEARIKEIDDYLIKAKELNIK